MLTTAIILLFIVVTLDTARWAFDPGADDELDRPQILGKLTYSLFSVFVCIKSVTIIYPDDSNTRVLLWTVGLVWMVLVSLAAHHSHKQKQSP